MRPSVSVFYPGKFLAAGLPEWLGWEAAVEMRGGEAVRMPPSVAWYIGKHLGVGIIVTRKGEVLSDQDLRELVEKHEPEMWEKLNQMASPEDG